MSYNKLRQQRLERAPHDKLKQIASSGSLSSSCAAYWLLTRFKEVAPTSGEIAWANSATAKMIDERRNHQKARGEQ